MLAAPRAPGRRSVDDVDDSPAAAVGGRRRSRSNSSRSASAYCVAAGRGGQLPHPHGRRVQQLLDDPVHGVGDLGPLVVGRGPGSRAASRRSSASTTSSARARSAATVGATSAPRQPAERARPPRSATIRAARRSTLGVRAGPGGRLRCSAVEVDDVHAGQRGRRRRRRRAARARSSSTSGRPARPRAGARRDDRSTVQHRPGRRGRGDHARPPSASAAGQVGRAATRRSRRTQLAASRAARGRRRGWSTTSSATPGARPASASGQRAHRAGADHQRRAGRPAAAERPRPRPSATRHHAMRRPGRCRSRRAPACRPAAPAASARAAAGRRRPARPRPRSRRAAGRGSAPRRPPSSPARRRPENSVPHRGVLVVHVQVRRPSVGTSQRRPGAASTGADVGEAAVEAGRPPRRPRPGCRWTAPPPRRRGRRASSSCRRPAARPRRRSTRSSSATGAVRWDSADDEQAHVRTASCGARRPRAVAPCEHGRACGARGRTGSAARSARSTLRTSTPSGTDEHARREVEDAGHAGRDQPVADRPGRRAAGVAMTPIAMSCSPTTTSAARRCAGRSGR